MEENLSLMTDLYELRMAEAYIKSGKKNKYAVFDYYFRKCPDDGGFCITAGLEQFINYILNMKFTEEDIEYLRSENSSAEFLDYLKNFKFNGSILAIPEGSVVFANEPIIKVIAPLPEAQLIESTLLNLLNHQTLIATKAARICLAANDDPVVDFGLRRAHGPSAAILGARAAYIGGCTATSDVKAGKQFKIPITGTMAHSWIESFPDEITAFREFSKTFPDLSIFLVDTYNTIKSGVPSAIQIGLELKKKGKNLKAIRLDSGDLAWLSKEARKMLDEAGLTETKIVASNDLDEWLIESLKTQQGAKIDIWGVGTKMITSYSTPALGGVYKLTALARKYTLEPKIKISATAEKITNPGNKNLYRIYQNGKMEGDIIALNEEAITNKESIELFHPVQTHVSKILNPPFEIENLLIEIIKDGNLIYKMPTLNEVKQRCKENLEKLDAEYKRLRYPRIYKVSLTKKLFELKQRMIKNHSGRKE